MDRPGFMASLVAGGLAGVSVDLILFPLDTIKTRLQSPQGFNKAGGFQGIYAGVPSAAIGSFPNAAAFFITYEYVKWFLHTDSSSYLTPMKHMLAASAGEVVACLIRVPSEVVKQRAQVSASTRTFQIFSNILHEEGIQGLYRGYKSTVLREIPFSLVQFPLWESLKVFPCQALRQRKYGTHNRKRMRTPQHTCIQIIKVRSNIFWFLEQLREFHIGNVRIGKA
uniref:S-adenosylmethionine mitochondrial carrier protein isoform X6 n=1 Tax=Callithrix jacchus TaxID=9483 RepID=UPI0004F0A741|nr:S-adenosylmethionine mitochondrial carrier protein isoform X6 [Callithrix jacchus]